MTERYIKELVAAYPSIREVWLYGSRANDNARPDSDWDYMAFADDDTLSDLSRDTRFHVEGIDLMIVTDGVSFAKPWLEDGRQKTGTLTTDDGEGGLASRVVSTGEARYRGTKPDGRFNVKVLTNQRAVRIYPA